MAKRINKQSVVQRFLRLTKIDNPSLNEREMADFLEQELDSLGIAWTEDKSYEKNGGTAGNIYAVLKGEDGYAPVLFSAHMDAVDVAVGKKAVLHEEEGIITSDGNTVLGADDLVGIAAIMEALEYIVTNRVPHRTIEILFSYAEELLDVGSKAFDFSVIQSKEAYILDGMGKAGTICYKSPTILSFEADITGKAAHVACPEGSVNAIKIAARAIDQINTGKIDENTSVNIGKIIGGNGGNIVPEHVLVIGEVRNYNHEAALELVEKIHDTFEKAAVQYGGSVEFRTRLGCKAYEQNLNRPVAERYRALCSEYGYEYREKAIFGGSDNNIFEANGIEGIVLAIGVEFAHSTSERVHTEEIRRAAESVLYLAGLK